MHRPGATIFIFASLLFGFIAQARADDMSRIVNQAIQRNREEQQRERFRAEQILGSLTADAVMDFQGQPVACAFFINQFADRAPPAQEFAGAALITFDADTVSRLTATVADCASRAKALPVLRGADVSFADRVRKIKVAAEKASKWAEALPLNYEMQVQHRDRMAAIKSGKSVVEPGAIGKDLGRTTQPGVGTQSQTRGDQLQRAPRQYGQQDEAALEKIEEVYATLENEIVVRLGDRDVTCAYLGEQANTAQGHGDDSFAGRPLVEYPPATITEIFAAIQKCAESAFPTLASPSPIAFDYESRVKLEKLARNLRMAQNWAATAPARYATAIERRDQKIASEEVSRQRAEEAARAAEKAKVIAQAKMDEESRIREAGVAAERVAQKMKDDWNAIIFGNIRFALLLVIVLFGGHRILRSAGES